MARSHAGETVHLQATSYDPVGCDITWAWARCSNPASSSVDACLAEIALTTIETGTPPLLASGVGLDNVDVTIAPDALDGLSPATRRSAVA